MKKIPSYLTLICIVLLISIGLAQAQETCTTLVEAALDAVADNCSNLDRNSACYGHDRLRATFFEPVEEDFFSVPSDRASLSLVSSIQTEGLDLENNIWGISVLNLQANVPNTLPGQNVTFLLVGDAQIENDVLADEAVPAIDPIEITLRADAPVFTSALEDTTQTVLEAGTRVLADAVNWNSRRVRILFNGTPGWIDRSAVNAPDILIQLPSITASSRTPMQAFYFSTGVETPTCNEAPSFISIQGAEDFVVNLNINGVDVRIGSLVVLRSSGDNRISISVIEGALQTVDGQIVRTGETLVALIDDENRLFAWETLRPLNDTEIAAGALSILILDALGLAQEPTTQPTTTPVPSAQTGVCPGLSGDQAYVVQRDDNLFQIARRFDTSISDIISRNEITDPTLLSIGQVLIVPDPCSGFVGLPRSTTTSGGASTTTSTCVPTSPLQGISHDELISFYWDPTANASAYRLNIYDASGTSLRSVITTAGVTTAVGLVSMPETRPGGQFQWDVQAFNADGSVSCTSRRVVVTRDQFPRPAPPMFAASLVCAGTFQYQFTWSGLAAGDTVKFTYLLNQSQGSSGPFNTPSGSTIISVRSSTSIMSYPVATLGSGVSVPVLPTSLSC